MSHKKLGALGATSLVLGNMIGSGIFLLPAALAFYGGISFLGWVFSSLGALLLAKVFARLSKEIPKPGGPYAFTRHGFGDFAGFLVAWGYWISLCSTNAAITVAMLGYLTVFFPVLGENNIVAVAVGLSAIWFLTWINIKGIRTMGKVQTITTILKVIPLLLVSIIGIFYMDWSNFLPFNLSGKSDFKAIMETAALTFFAFLGLECATVPSGQIKDGKKTVARSTMMGTLLAIGVYILSSMVLIGLIPSQELQTSEAPFADAARILFGEKMVFLVALGAIVSTFGALNGWLFTQSQMPMVAAQDKLFPKIFKRINKNGSPGMSICISSIIVSVIMLLNFSKGLVKAFEFMILLSTLTALVPYLFSTLTHVLISKEGKEQKGYWILGAVAFLFTIWAIIGLGAEVGFWGFIALLAGMPIYMYVKLINNN